MDNGLERLKINQGPNVRATRKPMYLSGLSKADQSLAAERSARARS